MTNGYNDYVMSGNNMKYILINTNWVTINFIISCKQKQNLQFSEKGYEIIIYVQAISKKPATEKYID